MFWARIARLILRNRIAIVVVVGLITLFMLWEMRGLKIDYGYSGMLPETDSVTIKLEQFNQMFGEDAGLFFFGFEDPDFYTLDRFRTFSELNDQLRQIEGVNSVLSVYDAINLKKNPENKTFDLYRVFPDTITDQKQLDSLAASFRSLPIYRDLVYSDSSNMFLMVMTMDKSCINTKDRVRIVDEMKALTEEYGKSQNLKIHYSGLPYVRTTLAEIIQREFIKFLILSAVATTLILFLFFRSLITVFFSVVIMAIGVVWALAGIVLIGSTITVLNAMIPALLIVIAVPNNIYLLNKYHGEYAKHKNKVKALHRVIQNVGAEIFMTNLTTAAGFATFMTINNEMIRNFGLISSVNIMVLYFLCLTLMPIFFSFLPPPREKHVRHLDNRVINRIVDRLVSLVRFKRKGIYLSVLLIVVVSAIGITRMKSTGYILDDIPKENPLSKDLKFFENSIRGVMPLEVAIDTKKPNGVLSGNFLRKVEDFQEYAEEFPELGRSFCIADGMKVAMQAYYNGDKKHYKLPSQQERAFILPYLSGQIEANPIIASFIDSASQKMRINMRIADVGNDRMEEITGLLQEHLDSLFSPGQYNTILTGSSMLYTLGTKYLIRNLVQSLAIAIFLIAIFIAWMYRNSRMVFVAVAGNLIPLLFTAGLMGYANISVKPSTLLVFSVTYGIAVDTAIHFLSKYRQHLACPGIDKEAAIIQTLREVGVSVIYTVSVLFVGFGIFVASEFGGTKTMGFLMSLTLLIAVIANLLLVPSILLGKIMKDKAAPAINQ
ncbi:MAG: MMPL family transporter [Bacteroidota bacterium]